MGNDRGAWSATPVSRDYPANHIDRSDEVRGVDPTTRFAACLRGLADDLADRRILPTAPGDLEDGAGEELAIETEFRKRLFGTRRLSRHEKPHAVRAARTWRAQALSALRERRARDRHASHLLRKLAMPQPS